MSPVGAKIKKWRKEKGLRQEDVEANTEGKISQAYLSDLERGKVKEPGLFKMAIIVDALGHTLQELTAEDDSQVARLRPTLRYAMAQ